MRALTIRTVECPPFKASPSTSSTQPCSGTVELE
ncbi:hypothetical protein PL9214520038 [Planktothrix tepida PCC 9214]|uniref:Uncharacterized protein n=1 Tax=Planktothrix tepida PCC 9214 TaxID=671072 RepID=A0A1J1LM02_9CYAN|nr:hypothetical protein PL9214520038 [Planktothrix tepida PCC 9214]